MIEASAAQMAAAIRDKRISPVELVQMHLDQIAELNPTLNAYVSLRDESALGDARAAEQVVMRGDKVGPLHGVPISIKSSIEVAGCAFETGSRLRNGQRGQTDAPLVARLKKAGAIVLGTTNVPEMLMNYFTDNSIYGRTTSPLDTERTPGGSSGGEAAAISACMSAAGIGSDGGGSIRVPAHYCGIFGLKPTPGRIPITGHFPESGGPFAAMGVVGPMARTAEDLRILFEVTAGYEAMDPSAAPVSTARKNPSKVRIGYFEDDGVTPVTAETAAAVRAAAAALATAGYEVFPFRPAKIREARTNWHVFFVQCGAAVLQPLFAASPGMISDGLEEFLEIGRRAGPLTRDELLQAWFARDQIRLEMMREMQPCPILLSPVCAIPAFKHGERAWTIAGKRVEYLEAMAYSQWLNGVGFPGASVPMGRSPEGLPIGVQVIGLPYQDETVLEIASELERSCGWIQPELRAGKRIHAPQ